MKICVICRQKKQNIMIELVHKTEVYNIIGAAMEVHKILAAGFWKWFIKKRWN